MVKQEHRPVQHMVMLSKEGGLGARLAAMFPLYKLWI